MSNTITMIDPLANESLKKQFGVFVGLYNKVNGTSLSVVKASKIPDMVNIFNANLSYIIQEHSTLVNNKVDLGAVSSKMKSYSMLNIPKVDKQVYDIIEQNEGISRFEVAQMLGRRVSTVCGAVNRLIFNNLVCVVGVTQDNETKRDVESLGINK